MDLTYQPPAQGILKNKDWGDSKSYRVTCQCSDTDHIHDLWIEAIDNDISVTVYTKVTTKFWTLTRWQQMWQLLTRGYLDQESTLMLTQQQAFNYAQTIYQAVEDIEDFKISTKNKS